jgi:hypothetical protein
LASQPGETIKYLQGWFKKEFGGNFTNLGNELACPEQKDSFSCGPYLINTINHAIFDAPLATHDNRRLIRVQYFITLAKAQLDWVGDISVMCSSH